MLKQNILAVKKKYIVYPKVFHFSVCFVKDLHPPAYQTGTYLYVSVEWLLTYCFVDLW